MLSLFVPRRSILLRHGNLVLRGGGQSFVTSFFKGVLLFVTKCDEGEGVQNRPKLRDVIYGRPLIHLCTPYLFHKIVRKSLKPVLITRLIALSLYIPVAITRFIVL